MNRLLCDDLWPALHKLAAQASSKRAAVAYVTSERYLKFGAGDVLIADASNDSIAAGQTSATLLERAHKRGAALYSLPDLHAKVMVLGGMAVIGSANISETSGDLIEAAWVTDQPAAVGRVTALLQELVRRATPIDEKFLQRILAIEVMRKPRRKKTSTPRTRIKVAAHRTWLVGVEEMTEDIPAEQKAIDRGMKIAEQTRLRSSSSVDWLRFTHDSKFRRAAQEGDTIIEIYSDEGASRPAGVYRHATILRRQDEPTCTRFFVEMVRGYERHRKSWSAFKKIAKRSGLSARIAQYSARFIPQQQANALFELWSEIN